MTIALAHNLKRSVRETDSVPFDFYSECDSPKTIEAIADALRWGGHTVQLVEAGTERLAEWFLTHAVDLVFNIAEGTTGAHRESQVPALLESLQIPFTGSSSLTLALALDKARTKHLLAFEGIPTPAWQVMVASDAPLNPRLQFPLIVKPNAEGSAKGILRESVVQDEAALRRQVQRIRDRYHQAALIEEFIEGVELTVGVLGRDPSSRQGLLGVIPSERRESRDDEPQVLPILEIDFAGCQRSGEFFYSWRMKEYQGDATLGLNPAFHCPARLDAATTARVQAVALRAHQALGCLDVSRTDIRLRADGVPFVLEVNPLPGLDPQESNLPIMTTAAGIQYPVLINRLVESALARDRGDRPFDAGHRLRPWALAQGRPERGEAESLGSARDSALSGVECAESKDDGVGATGFARRDPQASQPQEPSSSQLVASRQAP